MPATLTIHEETTSDEKTSSFTLDCLTTEVSFVKLVRLAGG
jgi:hypothetical protein